MSRIEKSGGIKKIQQQKKLNIQSPCKPCNDYNNCNQACYGNDYCCYRVNLIQVNDPTLIQKVQLSSNLELTSIPVEINTGKYTIESSSPQSPNDTLVVNKLGLYSIYFSLSYSVSFNSDAVPGNIFPVVFRVSGPYDDTIITAQQTLTIPNPGFAGQRVTNIIEGSRLKVINDGLPYGITINALEFNPTVVVDGTITVEDLTLIVTRLPY